MYLSLAALAFISLALAVRAEDVTLFIVPIPTTTGPLLENLVPGFSLLGVSPLLVDEGGTTHYVYSQAFSVVETSPSTRLLAATTDIFTLKADATRDVLEYTSTGPADSDIVDEYRYECTYQEDGTSVCTRYHIGKAPTTTITHFDTTFTGTRTPWATITNGESALPASDDDGGANRTLAHTSFLSVIVASIGLGVALVIA